MGSKTETDAQYWKRVDDDVEWEDEYDTWLVQFATERSKSTEPDEMIKRVATAIEDASKEYIENSLIAYTMEDVPNEVLARAAIKEALRGLAKVVKADPSA